MQGTFADIGTPLHEVTFVIVDLETTGGPAREAGITEIGAVKVRGGEHLGSFATLVNPERTIPPFIATLTGITNALVSSAPTLTSALPAFLEFLGDGVLVAHNAPYDVGFLKGACAQLDYTWPAPIIVDTARLARVALQPGEVRNCKLATLAAHFNASTQPIHRALADAEATTDVLHALIDRVGTFGVHTLPDLRDFTANVAPAQRHKRHLADRLPQKPGVYVFEDAQGTPLYIGTSRNIATRVRSYFTASEQRRRMADMISIAERVHPIVCATPLEAEVIERRLIATQQPRYNRRSRRADRRPWLKLTDEASPRLSIVRSVDPAVDSSLLGPFGGRRAAEVVMETLQFAFHLRTCTKSLAAQPRASVPACALAELGRCVAPCIGDHDRPAYAGIVEHVRRVLAGDIRELNERIHAEIRRLSAAERFEEAALWRDRLLATIRAVHRTHQLSTIWRNPFILAAEPTDSGGWDLHAVRNGIFIAAAHVPRGVDPAPAIEQLSTTESSEAEIPLAERAEETAIIARWLRRPGVRLVRVAEPLALPRFCGGAHAAELAAAQPFQLERGLRPVGPVAPQRFTRISLAG
jgi:DNA polymerase-3 subunit epsilon